MFFEIVGFKLGPFHFPMKLKVKIDIETNEYQIPAGYLSHFKNFDPDYKISSQGFQCIKVFWFISGRLMNVGLNLKAERK